MSTAYPRYLIHDDPGKNHVKIWSEEHEKEFLASAAGQGFHDAADYPKQINHPDKPGEHAIVNSELEERQQFKKWKKGE